MIPEIPISALNHYDYCPYRCYLIYITHEFQDNVYTIEGTDLHQRVNTSGETTRGGIRQYRGIWLHSSTYGLYGRADLVEAEHTSIYPVEYKHGSKGDWKNDRLQLCAQALCLEEMLQIAPIEHAFIYYAQSHQRTEVPLTTELREQTILTIQQIRQLFTEETKAYAIYTKRCRGCSLYSICLPKEMEKARQYAKNNQEV